MRVWQTRDAGAYLGKGNGTRWKGRAGKTNGQDWVTRLSLLRQHTSRAKPGFYAAMVKTNLLSLLIDKETK